MDIDFNEVFNVEQSEEDNGAKEAEPAEQPDEEIETEGAEEQETAEPADDADDDDESADTESADDDGSQPKGKKDSVYAAARRKAEAEADRKVDKIIADMGWIDPYTKQPIKSKADYDQYKKSLADENRQKVQEKTGMSRDEFNEFIDNLPEVQQAKAAQQQAMQQQVQSQIAEELKAISALDPDIHTVEDVLKGENGKKISGYVARGITMLDAFKLVNYDRLRSTEADEDRRHADRNAASKSHLTQSKSRGQGMISVPQETLKWYRMYNPNMTDAEIQRDYNKYLKDNGG